MREIKFRAFHKEKGVLPVYGFNEEFVFIEDYNSPCEGENILPIGDCELMQFTGLKDKNGVDIYEGDLIKNVGTPKLKQVVYHDQAFYLREGNAHTRLSKLNFDGEIIGNIHEHKHLLK